MRPGEASLGLRIGPENVSEGESWQKEKAQAGKLAPNFISTFRLANPEG
jgi:hypothetical protein